MDNNNIQNIRDEYERRFNHHIVKNIIPLIHIEEWNNMYYYTIHDFVRCIESSKQEYKYVSILKQLYERIERERKLYKPSNGDINQSHLILKLSKSIHILMNNQKN